jgi:hypothetical protein
MSYVKFHTDDHFEISYNRKSTTEKKRKKSASIYVSHGVSTSTSRGSCMGNKTI